LDSDPVIMWWASLTVTSAPSAGGGGTTYVTNNITLGAVTVGVEIAEGAIVVDSPIYLTNNITFSQSNVVQFAGEFTQVFNTNIYNSYLGVNVFSPVVVATNVSGTWTVSLTTNYPVGIYRQSGAINSVVFSVDSTNDVALANVLFVATTNSITWPTGSLIWAVGSAPTMATGLVHSLYFEAHRGLVYGVYIGGRP